MTELENLQAQRTALQEESEDIRDEKRSVALAVADQELDEQQDAEFVAQMAKLDDELQKTYAAIIALNAEIEPLEAVEASPDAQRVDAQGIGSTEAFSSP